MLVLTSAMLAGIGLVQFFQSHRYPRDRKRASQRRHAQWSGYGPICTGQLRKTARSRPLGVPTPNASAVPKGSGTANENNLNIF